MTDEQLIKAIRHYTTAVHFDGRTGELLSKRSEVIAAIGRVLVAIKAWEEGNEK